MKEQIIKSKDNDKIKFLKKLGHKKYRRNSGQFLVENFIIIEDAQKAGYDFKALYVTSEFKIKNQERLNKIIKKGRAKEYYLIDYKINKSFSQLETPSGICAVYDKPAPKLNFNQSVVYLNKISDPGNLGTILRSALAFNLKNIVIDENCADLYNPKTISSAKEAIFKLNIEFDYDSELFKKIKKQMPIYATSLKGETDLSGFKTKKFCLVLGNEASGVDEKIIKQADKIVKIKMSDNIESLNVASAAAILLYESYKK